ncbi:MAG: DUF4190 domain-containing protein [Phycisphaerales bacterium]|nr:MAG: DUF4190 domain-containing protein [Phycisphaerales bacterium]
MYCSKCGVENPDDVQSCRSCGAPLTDTSAQMAGAISKTSGLAIASLVLAILSPFTCMITAIPAIILGIVALVKILNSAGRLRGTGLAVAGIAVPVVALPITALLMGILMPALARTRQLAFRMTCATNLSGLGKAMLIYAGDYDALPTPSEWCDLLAERAAVAEQSFRCRGAHEGPCNYAMNKNVQELGLTAPPDMVLLFETHPGWNQSGGPETLTTDNHEGDGCNVLFIDSLVEFVKTERLDKLRWTAD